MRRLLVPILLLGLVCAAYAAWPVFGLYQLGAALRDSNPDAVLARVDLASIRRSIVGQVVAEAGRDPRVDAGLDRLGEVGGQLALRAAAAELDRRLAGLITPEDIRELILRGRLRVEGAAGNDGGQPVQDTGDFIGLPENPFAYLQSYGFSSLRKAKTVLGKPDAPDDWLGLSLRLSGFRWKLIEIQLPRSVLSELRAVLESEIGARS